MMLPNHSDNSSVIVQLPLFNNVLGTGAHYKATKICSKNLTTGWELIQLYLIEVEQMVAWIGVSLSSSEI